MIIRRTITVELRVALNVTLLSGMTAEKRPGSGRRSGVLRPTGGSQSSGV